MSHQQVTEQLRAMILVENTELAPDFSSAADLYLDLGLPSVQAMLLLQTCEETYAISIPDDQFVEATTLDKLATLVVSLRTA